MMLEVLCNFVFNGRETSKLSLCLSEIQFYCHFLFFFKSHLARYFFILLIVHSGHFEEVESFENIHIGLRKCTFEFYT